MAAQLKLVLVDLDGTLIKGTSAEKTFLWFLIRRHYIRGLNVLRFILRMFWLIPTRGWHHAKGENKAYLQGVPLEQLQQWIREYTETVLPSLLSPTLCRRILELKERGCTVVLLSGSLQLLVEQVQSSLQVDAAFGVPLRIQNGKASGSIDGLFPFGKDKVKVLLQQFDSDQVDWRASWAFADRYQDLPVFNLVGHPVVVNPKKKLFTCARKHGWEILNT